MVQHNSLDEPYICHTVEHAKEIEILEQLKTHRLVETDSTLSSKTAGLVGDQSRWVMAAGAFSQLRIVQALFSKQNKTKQIPSSTKQKSVLGDGTRFFDVPRDMDPTVASIYQLAMMLHHEGWHAAYGEAVDRSGRMVCRIQTPTSLLSRTPMLHTLSVGGSIGGLARSRHVLNALT